MFQTTSTKVRLLYLIGIISLLHIYFLSVYHTKNDVAPVSLRGNIKSIQSIQSQAPPLAVKAPTANLIEDIPDFTLYGSLIKGDSLGIISVVAIVGFNTILVAPTVDSITCIIDANEIITDTVGSEGIVRLLNRNNENNSSKKFELTCNFQTIDISKISIHSYKNINININLIINSAKSMSFSIPLNKRRAGYMLETTQQMSNFDAWNMVLPQDKSPAASKKIKIYVCVPGIDILPTRQSLPIYLEFLQHHFLLGIQHIFLGVHFHKDSTDMQRLLLILNQYINDGLLTINSLIAPNSPTNTSLLINRDKDINNIYIKLCLQLSFGVTDYFGVWDIRDFLIPKLPYDNILEVLKYFTLLPSLFIKNYNTTTTKNNIIEYLPNLPALLLPTQAVGASRWGLQELWLGDTHNAPGIPIQWEKEPSNRPKPIIFKLTPFGKCSQTYNSNYYNNHNTSINSITNTLNFPPNSQPDSPCTQIQINTTNRLPVILPPYSTDDTLRFLVLLYRHIPNPCPRVHRNLGNEYTHRFYEKVREKLHQTNVDLFVTLPEKVGKNPPNVTYWTMYNDIYYSIFPVNKSLSMLNITNNTTNTLPYNITYILPKTTLVDSTNTSKNIIQLPAVAVDYSELFLGALLERNFDSFTLQLAIFLLCPASLDPAHAGLGAISIRNDVIDEWVKVFRKTKHIKYAPGGQRERVPRYFCRISNRREEKEYLVEGVFIPNKVTPDAGANSRTDILRCPLKGVYRYLARSSEVLTVEVLRESQGLLSFEVPWTTRKTGYLLDGRGDASRFDVWKGYPPTEAQTTYSPTPEHLNVTTPYVKTVYVPTNQLDDLYMCVPGVETGPGKNILPLFLEFVQHHLLLGVSHIFLATIFTWSSPIMNRFLQIFRSFIEEGSVSFASQAGDDVDLVSSVEGIFWNRNIPKITYINMCLYLSKGMADYVGVWDTDEYFIPKFPYNSIMDVIRVVDVPPSHRFIRNYDSVYNNLTVMETSWTGGRGLADRDGHPLCYLSLSALVVLKDINYTDPTRPWLGQKFSHAPEAFESKMTNMKGFRKTIIPTRRIFHAGLHFAGACVLDSEWNGCSSRSSSSTSSDNEFCYEKTGKVRKMSLIPRKRMFFDEHRVDEVVWEKDYKYVDLATEALIYHYYTIHRDAITDPIFHVSEEAKSRPNEYTTRFFSNVINELERRDLTKFMS